MNDSCTPDVLDAHPVQDHSLLGTIIEKLTPDQSGQKVDLCQAREKTPYRELLNYGDDLTHSMSTAHKDVQMNVTANCYTVFDTNTDGNHRLLFRTSSDATFKTSAESAYVYDDAGKLTEVLERSSSPKFEVVRKSSLTADGWREEQWNRYGTQFNKMPTTIGQTEFQAQADGSVMRINRTTETPMGAAPIGRATIELRTIYDAEGRVMILKRL